LLIVVLSEDMFSIAVTEGDKKKLNN